jgi:putative intracellular protease/amidase
MKRIILTVVTFFCMTAAMAATKPSQPKVLLVVSSEGRDNGKRPGFEMDEFALAYMVLRDNNLKVEAASPNGGAVEADKFNPEDDHIKAFLADPEGQRLLKNTRKTQDVRPGEHVAIMIIGGKGAMFDLPKDAGLRSLLATHYADGGLLAAVCHGPAVFAEVKLANGTPLVQGKRMTGFTDEEESVFGKKWAKEYPFLLETKMRANGAIWDEAAPMMPKLVVDGRLITGQNPFSTAQTAEAIVRGLGRKPVARTVFMDESSMQLVERWLSGEEDNVRALLKADAKRYKTDLIGYLGVTHFKLAVDNFARKRALSIMLLAEPYMPHPRLALTIAEAHIALGSHTLAREKLNQVLTNQTDKAVIAESTKLLEMLPKT